MMSYLGISRNILVSFVNFPCANLEISFETKENISKIFAKNFCQKSAKFLPDLHFKPNSVD